MDAGGDTDGARPTAKNSTATAIEEDEELDGLIILDEVGESPPSQEVVAAAAVLEAKDDDDDVQFVAEVCMPGRKRTSSAISKDVKPLSAAAKRRAKHERKRRRIAEREEAAGGERLPSNAATSSTQSQVLKLSFSATIREQLDDQPTQHPDFVKNVRALQAKFPRRFEYFDRQLMDFYTLHKQYDTTFAWKMQARQYLQESIREIFPHSCLYAVGSSVNGCGSFDSDMDVCCCIPNDPHYNDRSFALRTLKRIQKHFFKCIGRPAMSQCLVITAKVPILRVKFAGKYEGLQVDLNVNNYAGIRNSHLIHYYARIDDRFPALCLLVKRWAKAHDVGDAMMGTLNSYSLILLCLHYLQCVVQPAILPNLQSLCPHMFDEALPVERCLLFQNLSAEFEPNPNPSTLGELLIGFFDYFSRFDFSRWAISIQRGSVFLRDDLCESTRRFRMFIEEPYDGNNTARCVTTDAKFYAIQQAFTHSRKAFFGKRKPDIKLIGLSHKPDTNMIIQ